MQRAKLGPAQSALFATVHSEKPLWRKHSTASVSRFASGFDFVAAAFRRGNLSFQFVSRDAAAHQSLGFASAFDFVAAAFRRAGLSFQCVSSNAAVHGYLVLVL